MKGVCNIFRKLLLISLALNSLFVFSKPVHVGTPVEDGGVEFEYNPPTVYLKVPSSCPLAKLNSEKTSFLNPDQKCDFYACAAQAANDQKVCGLADKQSYFLNYGEKYCKRFSSRTEKSLSPEGRGWLNRTLACLQNSLVEVCNQKKECSNCGKIRKLAFDTHPYCYVSSGLCKLSLEDQIEVAKTVDSNDFFTVESLAQVSVVGADCGSHLSREGLSVATQAMNEVRKNDPIFNRYVASGTSLGDSGSNYAQSSLAWTKRVRYRSDNQGQDKGSLVLQEGVEVDVQKLLVGKKTVNLY